MEPEKPPYPIEPACNPPDDGQSPPGQPPNPYPTQPACHPPADGQSPPGQPPNPYPTQPVCHPPADGQSPPGQPPNPYPPPNSVGYYPQQYPTGYAQPPYPYPGAQPQQQQQSFVMMGQPQMVIVQPYTPALNFTGHIVFSCLVFWCCGCMFGLIAFILAMVGQGQVHSDPAGARRLANASLGLSIAGVVVGIALIIGLAIFIKIQVSNAILEANKMY